MAASSTLAPFDRLPNELVRSIFDHCDLDSLVQLASSCQRFRQVCNEGGAWKAATSLDYHDRKISSLQKAAEQGHRACVEVCLELDRGADVLKRYYWAALNGAIAGGHCDLIPLAVQRFGVRNEEPTPGPALAAIRTCTQRGLHATLRYMHLSEPIPQWKLCYHREAVRYALQEDDPVALEILWPEENAPPVHECLQQAAKGVGAKLMERFLQEGADPNYFPDWGNPLTDSWWYDVYPPLASAVEVKNWDGVEVLLHRGARLNTPAYGARLLCLAAGSVFSGDPLTLEKRREAIIALLLSKGVDPNAAAAPQLVFTPLQELAQSLADNDVTPSMKLLLHAGADPNYAPYETQNTALHICAYRAEGEQGMARAKLLIESGADLHARNTDGKTAVQCARDPDVRAYLHNL